MKTIIQCGTVFLATMTLAVSTANAQKAPRIGYVYPAGGQQGQTFEVTVGGQGLTGVSDVYFTGRGVEEARDEIAEIKDKLAYFGNGRPFNNAIAENVTLRVTMAPDAKLGDQEIRVASPNGLSNPLVFCVGQIPEFSEPAARGSLKAEIDANPRHQRKREPKADVKPINLPVVI
jgi:hypothetical protein